MYLIHWRLIREFSLEFRNDFRPALSEIDVVVPDEEVLLQCEAILDLLDSAAAFSLASFSFCGHC